ncbi:FliA/WhiG family RNA polymerase sigma factor [Neobacillus sp. YX16]|uniref:sigma-70 family RNA polymerase sigma factor n=1 Tax=Neobacillus sp. YX16 TaxID=3047874 RepID=UPI0024C2840B|nr:FliA/WhiG family RNA polymerase sigma factor [Neobacillus sp. YX16]WHZ05428.1 FliA/WhiG family RNA polymerase sigma factor [Neobacillus sp. YX16]
MRPAMKETIPHYSLWKAYRENHDSKSQDQLVKQYLPLVDQMANRLGSSIPQHIIQKEDLAGLGYIGLIEAIKKFDYKKGYQFETFGLWRIKGAMLDGIRQTDWVPRGVREKAKKLNNALRELEQSLMRTPTELELSQHTSLSLEEVDQAFATLSLSTLLSLNEPLKVNEDDGKQQSRMDQIADDQTFSQDKKIQMEEFKKLIAASIDKMSEKERLVITLIYYEGLSQVEITEVLNLTKGRVSQIHSQAILKMRKSFEAKGFSLDSFL